MNAPSLVSQGPNIKGFGAFSALESLELTKRELMDPILWSFSPQQFKWTIATLPSSARLSRLSLPTGKLSSLNSFTQYLDEAVLQHLKELLFPNISRVLLDERGFGRLLLAACEERGVRVVFQEELALLNCIR
ncbi:hypothetical protein RQP46_003650 [Phenoliferia psychrophenolica]